MPKDQSLRKVMVIGSGPIVIGQAAEFDYAGTQACKALREEGLQVVLVNSNPATIMTDTNMADKVYIEPLTVEYASMIIEKEAPEGLLPTLGGQTGLNLATMLAKQGVLEKHGVRLLGTPLEAIERAEDRQLFKSTMQSIGEPVPESSIVGTVQEALAFARDHGFPVIVRPAYTLGGTGGGIAHHAHELAEIAHRGLSMSMIQQLLLEECVIGWKEIEFEVMRDGADNCIVICSMENVDPMGVHTGDSVVVAPALTLTDQEYHTLRSASLNIIRALGIEGGCNVQFAVDPKRFRYYVIEVNPRVSRSSALASKATGYPIARVASKIAVGLRLDEIPNAVTKQTMACFEPTIDYVVIKIPRWPFDKFSLADRHVGTQMKATGEVMAIDRTFEGALMKAIRSLEIGMFGLQPKGKAWTEEDIKDELRRPTDQRLFAVFQAFRAQMTVQQVHHLCSIDPWFLERMRAMVELDSQVRMEGADHAKRHLRQLKRLGFADRYLGQLTGEPERRIRQWRLEQGLRPTYKMVDTCAAEFEAATPYYYSTYEQEDEAHPQPVKKVVVLGSGPIRIGQGIEFDYCSVHSAWALREEGYQSIIINNNPETVSTDFDTSDKLYFEPLTEEDVLNIMAEEQPDGVVVQFGGQTAINLVSTLHENGVNILGTPPEFIDVAEDRDKFERLLRELRIPKPPGRAVTSEQEALEVAKETRYPVLVRPSYVLGGRAMEIVYSPKELRAYIGLAVDVSPEHPVLVDRYVVGKEVEVDVICDGAEVLLPGIMEHIERAGVHSGDSMAVYPPVSLSPRLKSRIVDYAVRLCRALHIKGLMNIQFVVEPGLDEKLYVLEVNPRASRTVPYISKITGLPMVNIATRVMLGRTLRELGYQPGLFPERPYYAVKAPVFSFSKLTRVDVALGPEMKSTGEVMGVDPEYSRALYKAMLAAGVDVPAKGNMVATIADRDKPQAAELMREFADLGFHLHATKGTAAYLAEQGIKAEPIGKISEESPNIMDLIQAGHVDLVVNTISRGKGPAREGAKIRRASVEHNIPCLTSLDTAWALLYALSSRKEGERFEANSIDSYLADLARPTHQERGS